VNGDTNYLSSPIRTIHRIMTHSCVLGCRIFVDIGGGEGIPSLFMRLVHHKTVVCCDHQRWCRRWVQWGCRLLRVSRVRCQFSMPYFSDNSVVFLCVWTSWSRKNRQRVMATCLTHIPSGGYLVTVSHGVAHPDFIQVHQTVERFAWGDATVYYYRHA
jgi:hypothetical protein